MVDLLAVCAHPDDLEVCAAGIFAKAKRAGKKTGLIILTQGEAGGFCDAATRRKEAAEGASVLGLDYFKILDFPDAGLFFSPTTVEALTPLIREASPEYILTFIEDDYHPDHVAASKITKAACFCAGLKKNSKDDSIWHYRSILYFGADNRSNLRRPDIYIDISDVMETKKAACAAHASQNILPYALSLASAYGSNAGTEYAEGLYLSQSLVLDNIVGIFRTGKRDV